MTGRGNKNETYVKLRRTQAGHKMRGKTSTGGEDEDKKLDKSVKMRGEFYLEKEGCF